MDTFWNRRSKKKKKEIRGKKEVNNRLIKDRIIKDVRGLFEQEQEDYYKPKRVSNFWNNNYIEYESNGDKNRNLSLDEYLNKIEHYLRNIIINLQKSHTWKIQLTTAINFISSKVAEEDRIMHSRSNNIKFTSYNDGSKVAHQLFESLRSRYQGNLETSIRESDFNFYLIQLMYYKCHKVNFKCGGTYIDSSDWIYKNSNNKSEK